MGPTPERTHYIHGSLCTQRRQYGLKHSVTSAIHTGICDTLHKVVMEISDIGNGYKLLGKKLVIDVLCWSKEDKRTIYVGDKVGTINALVSLSKSRTQ